MTDLDTIIARMYAGFCFEAGQRPDWKTQDEIFAPGARMVRVNDDGVFAFDLGSFRRDFDRMIDSGEMPSFWEGELWRETHLFGDVAHVLSAYEMRRSRGREVLNRAVKSIQLFEQGGRWWVSAMVWRREGREVAIPDTCPRKPPALGSAHGRAGGTVMSCWLPDAVNPSSSATS